MVRDHRHFLGEPLDMLGLALEIGERDEQREIDIVVTLRLDPVVEQSLHPLPDTEAPGLDHHAAAYARFLGHVGGGNHLLIPGGKIIGAAGAQGVANFSHRAISFNKGCRRPLAPTVTASRAGFLSGGRNAAC